jgi:hypothetical protein
MTPESDKDWTKFKMWILLIKLGIINFDEAEEALNE